MSDMALVLYLWPRWDHGTAMKGISAHSRENKRTVATHTTSPSSFGPSLVEGPPAGGRLAPSRSFLRRTKHRKPVKSWGGQVLALTRRGRRFFCVLASFIGKKHSPITSAHFLISLFF